MMGLLLMMGATFVIVINTSILHRDNGNGIDETYSPHIWRKMGTMKIFEWTEL